MRSSTVCEIDAGSRKGLQYRGEVERSLFSGFSSMRPKLAEFTKDGVISLFNIQDANRLAPRDEDFKITEDSLDRRLIWDQQESTGKYEVPSSVWPIAGNLRLTNLQGPSAIRIGHLIGDVVQVPEKALYSTATNFSTAATYDPISVGPAHNAKETFYWMDLFQDAIRHTAALIVLPDLSPDPIPSETLRALEKIKELPDNWDGDGASRIDEKTVSKAERLIREAFLASRKRLTPPSVAPAFGGMIVAEWSGPEGRELILDIPAGDDASGFLLVEHSPEGEELETDDELGTSWSMRELITRLLGD